MKTLRIGIVGTGLAAENLYLPALKKLKQRITIVACCNRTRKKAERFARLAKVPTVVDTAEQLIALPQVDAVVIALPIELQPKYVLKALKAGKAVLSEKPVAPNVAAGARLLKAAKRFKQPWLVAENFAFMPHVLWAEGLLAAGKLGDLRLVEVTQMNVLRSDNPYFKTTWRRNSGFKGGYVLDAGVHLAHVLRRYFGLPTAVRGLTASFNPALPPLDTAIATLRFSSGALGMWRSCFSVRHPGGPMIKLYGGKADLELHWDHGVLISASGARKVFKAKETSYYYQFEHFADAVLRGAKLRVSPAETLADLKFMQAIVDAR